MKIMTPGQDQINASSNVMQSQYCLYQNEFNRAHKIMLKHQKGKISEDEMWQLLYQEDDLPGSNWHAQIWIQIDSQFLEDGATPTDLKFYHLKFLNSVRARIRGFLTSLEQTVNKDQFKYIVRYLVKESN